MKYAYIRVSTKDQNLDRQIVAVKEYAPDILDENFFADKQSGKNFERDSYKRLKDIVRPGDEIIIKELDRLGRNKEAVKKELQWFRDKKVIVRVLSIPTSMIQMPEGQEWIMDMVNNILIEVIAAIDEQERKKIRERQAEGIACAKDKGVKFGRPLKNVELVLLDGETISSACKRLGISRDYWYSHKNKEGQHEPILKETVE